MKSNLLKILWVLSVGILPGARLASAGTICPSTVNTNPNTDCGYLLTIGPGNLFVGNPVAGAFAYDGNDDVTVGVINNSGATFNGSIFINGSGNGGGILAFDGDGICSYIGPRGIDPNSFGTYCTPSQVAAGVGNPVGDQGPMNTFSGINASGTSGNVVITGLADGATTFFSLESAPATIVPPNIVVTPEPGSLILLGIGLLAFVTPIRRKLKP